MTKTAIQIILLAALMVWQYGFANSLNGESQTLTLLHFSDYHSNAMPTHDDAGQDTGGIARAISYLKSQDGRDTLIFSGGDMMNKGAPAWSDKYRCAEWPWFNGLVDAMALGNHDADYGAQQLTNCVAEIDYPILSANTLNNSDQPAFEYAGKNYAVYMVGRFKVGAFALAGKDFDALIDAENEPVIGASFASREQVAKRVVQQLRVQEKADLVVLIGHGHYEDDLALAQNVTGIDLIFGSHSHRREALAQISGAQTWYISAGQYLSHIAKVTVELSQNEDKPTEIKSIRGELVAMSEHVVPEPEIDNRVKGMQQALERDPDFAAKFKILGQGEVALTAPVEFDRDSVLGNYVCDVVRKASDADIALFTSSTFRKSIPRGPIREHHLIDALPYDNKLHVYSLTGKQIRELLAYSVARQGSDFFSQISGLRVDIDDGRLGAIKVGHGEAWLPLKDDKRYKLITSDFQSKVAAGYKDILASLEYQVFDQSLREMVRAELRQPTFLPALDGRIKPFDQ
jgi:5'-nucleotidase